MFKTRQSTFTRSKALASRLLLATALLALVLPATALASVGAGFTADGVGKVLRYLGCAVGIAAASTIGALAGAVIGCFILLATEVS